MGRKMRELLQVVKDTWSNDRDDPTQNYCKMSTCEYMTQLNDKIEKTLQIANENESLAQRKMKQQYDRLSLVRQLNPGDTVLVLIPTSNNKLFATWRGPYNVIRSCGNDNYEIQICKRKTILHINSLRKYNFPETEGERVNMMIVSGQAEEYEEGLITGLPDEPDIDTAVDSHPTPVNQFTMGEQLTADQKTELQRVLAEYPDVFSDKPGCTHLIEHKIRLTDDVPCYEAPYRIPESMKDAVEAELMEMLENDIIQYDETTPYCSPLIVVRKCDGGIRLVNNFIKLNSKTIKEQYMMSNLTDLVSRVAGSRFISCLDIRQAYWEIPMEAESIKFTGFHTFCGSFSYKRMHQGLCGAAFSCQRLLNLVLRGMHRYTGCLIDDILD